MDALAGPSLMDLVSTTPTDRIDLHPVTGAHRTTEQNDTTPETSKDRQFGPHAGDHSGFRAAWPVHRVAADSVEDVERVSQGSVEFGSLGLVEVSNRLSVKRLDRNSDDVVAADDAGLGKAFVRSYRDLGSYASGGAGDRRACDRRQD